MIESLTLKANPIAKQIIQAAFPNYRKTKFFLSQFSESGMNINSYWDGGSRDEFAVVDLNSMTRKQLPTSTHPYFDVAARGLADQSTPDVESDGKGNLTLKHLPEGFALVRAGTFCGKPATAHLYLNTDNMTKLLSQP